MIWQLAKKDFLNNIVSARWPVAFETVPLFQEKSMSLADRLLSSLKYLITNIAFIAIIFSLSYVLFIRYNVR